MISDSLYSTVFLFSILGVILVSVLKISLSSYGSSIKPNIIGVFALVLPVIIYIGLRPNSELMGDTVRYTMYFNDLSDSFVNESRDYGFYTLMLVVKKMELGITVFYLLIATIYVGCLTYACRITLPSYTIYTLLVFMGSLSFLTYGINGIRNGSAMAIFVLGLSMYFNKNKYIAVLIILLSITFHSSLTLIVLLFFISILCKNYIKLFFLVWIVCLVLSITTDRYFENLFISLGLLGDKTEYLLDLQANDQRTFSVQGYRYDFAIYGSIPVIYIFWNYSKKKFVFDNYYVAITSIYMLANAFWLLMNQNWLSNRYAYLSWALYPIILVYPLTKGKTLHTKRVLNAILVLNIFFSIIMWTLDKYR